MYMSFLPLGKFLYRQLSLRVYEDLHKFVTMRLNVVPIYLGWLC